MISVCKRWQKLSQLPWHDVKELDIGGFKTLGKNEYGTKLDFTFPILEQVLLLCGPSLTRIKFTGANRCLSPIKDLLAIVRERCPNLRSIDFGYWMKLRPSEIEILIRDYNHITDFAFSKCWRNAEESLSRFFANSKLQFLDIAQCDHITGLCFQSLPAEYIESFKLHKCGKIIPQNFASVSFFFYM